MHWVATTTADFFAAVQQLRSSSLFSLASAVDSWWGNGLRIAKSMPTAVFVRLLGSLLEVNEASGPLRVLPSCPFGQRRRLIRDICKRIRPDLCVELLIPNPVRTTWGLRVLKQGGGKKKWAFADCCWVKWSDFSVSIFEHAQRFFQRLRECLRQAHVQQKGKEHSSVKDTQLSFI